MKVCFWNIAGMMNKEEDTWDYLEEFDIIGLTETWVEEGAWKKLKRRLSSEYDWSCIQATRGNKKGRAKGGIIMAIRKEIREVEIKEISKRVMQAKIEYNGHRWRIVTIYSQNVEEVLEEIMEEIPEKEEELLIIGGDDNARTGNEGGPIGTGKLKEEETRKSKDKMINREGRIMLNKIKKRGWMIMNGSGEKKRG